MDPLQNFFQYLTSASGVRDDEFATRFIASAMGIDHDAPLKVLVKHLGDERVVNRSFTALPEAASMYLALRTALHDFLWKPEARKAHPAFFPYHRLLEARSLVATTTSHVLAVRSFKDVRECVDAQLKRLAAHTGVLIEAGMHTYIAPQLTALRKALLKARAPGPHIHQLDAMIHPEIAEKVKSSRRMNKLHSLVPLLYRPDEPEVRVEVIRQIDRMVPPDVALSRLLDLLEFEWMHARINEGHAENGTGYGNPRVIGEILDWLNCFAGRGYAPVVRPRVETLLQARLDDIRGRLVSELASLGEKDTPSPHQLDRRVPAIAEALRIERVLGASEVGNAGAMLLDTALAMNVGDRAAALIVAVAGRIRLSNNAFEIVRRARDGHASAIIRYAAMRTLMTHERMTWNVADSARDEFGSIEAHADYSAVSHLGLADPRARKLMVHRLDSGSSERRDRTAAYLSTYGWMAAEFFPRLRELYNTHSDGPYSMAIESIETAVHARVRSLIANLLDPQMVGAAMMLSINEIGQLAPLVPAAAEEAMPYLERLATIAQVMPQYLHLYPKITSAIGLIMRVTAR